MLLEKEIKKLVEDYNTLQRMAEKTALQWVIAGHPGYQAYDVKISPDGETVSCCVGHYDGIMCSPLRGTFPIRFIFDDTGLAAHAREKKAVYDQKRKELFDKRQELTCASSELKKVESRIATQSLDFPDGWEYSSSPLLSGSLIGNGAQIFPNTSSPFMQMICT